jgi:SAM-dependent methyltransferase
VTHASVSTELRARYAHYYDGPSAWRSVGARDKVANLLRLCSHVPHRSVVEIGAGEGALLACLAERGFAERLHGIDISPSALSAARERAIRGVGGLARFDGYALPFGDQSLDLAVVSHVLEHVEYPRMLLAEAARVASRVFVEVPLEDTWRLPRDYVPNAIGHINFYTARGLRQLVQSCGLTVLGEHVSNPDRATYESRRDLGVARGRARWAVKQVLLGLAPALAQRLFTYHGALLCTAGKPPARGRAPRTEAG